MISFSTLNIVFVFLKKPKFFPRMPNQLHKSIIHKMSEITIEKENSNMKSLITYGWARSLYGRLGTAFFREDIATNNRTEEQTVARLQPNNDLQVLVSLHPNIKQSHKSVSEKQSTQIPEIIDEIRSYY